VQTEERRHKRRTKVREQEVGITLSSLQRVPENKLRLSHKCANRDSLTHSRKKNGRGAGAEDQALQRHGKTKVFYNRLVEANARLPGKIGSAARKIEGDNLDWGIQSSGKEEEGESGLWRN